MNTPETDAIAAPHIGFYSCATVPAEFARRLERERNQARAENQQTLDIRQELAALTAALVEKTRARYE